MKTQLYQITKGIAAARQLPIYFVAVEMARTQKAVYLYGRGTTETARKGVCCRCGRTLTHPVSLILGIGPECGSHYWNWDIVKNAGYTDEDIKLLTQKIHETIRVDCWIPISQIVSVEPTEETVEIPKNHAMFNFNDKSEKEKTASLAETVRGKQVIKLQFPYSPQDIERVRTLPERSWNPEKKYWVVPLNVQILKQLQEWGFTLDSELRNYLKQTIGHVSEMSTIEIPGLKGTLYPFQQQGVTFIENKNGRALIADQMGLGKTVQALAWLQLHPEKRAIIIATSSAKWNWQVEAQRWLTENHTVVVRGKTPQPEIIKDARIIIINYDILDDWLEELQKFAADVLIIDEGHKIKNSSAQRTKATKLLAKSIPHRIGLTGTPFLNKPVEIYNLVKLINPTILEPFWDFAFKYCGAKHNGFAWEFNGATNTEELHQLLVNTVMIRRLKKDVLPELPDKTYSLIPLEINNRQEYETATKDFINFIREKKGNEAALRASLAEALTQLRTLMQITAKGKLKAVIEWIEDYLEGTDEKLVVFAHHKIVIDELVQNFKKISVKIDGSVPSHHRQSIVEQFQTDPNIRLFIGNTEAAGESITLTAASTVAFIELPLTPGSLAQAEDRVHRIGQKQAVQVCFLFAKETVDEKVANWLDRKRRMIDAVLDGVETPQENLINELIKNYNYENEN